MKTDVGAVVMYETNASLAEVVILNSRPSRRVPSFSARLFCWLLLSAAQSFELVAFVINTRSFINLHQECSKLSGVYGTRMEVNYHACEK